MGTEAPHRGHVPCRWHADLGSHVLVHRATGELVPLPADLTQPAYSADGWLTVAISGVRTHASQYLSSGLYADPDGGLFTIIADKAAWVADLRKGYRFIYPSWAVPGARDRNVDMQSDSLGLAP